MPGSRIDLLQRLPEAAAASLGFFWKAGWAFVLGYAISAMIQAFVPRSRLSRAMGRPSAKSVTLASVFGAISSSCSFAALSAGRTLVRKGAHFVAAVAFLFASTNLVIELGALILVFLGPEYLAAELVGGVVLIAISSTLVRLTYPKAWMAAAREKVEREVEDDEEDFDWRSRLKSRDGWRLVAKRFAGEWGMVWQEITIGFTVAGLIAALVPDSFFRTLFRVDEGGDGFLAALHGALLGPLLAACTFIGSMGNIPLATVLASGGVAFAGVIAFIYSDLMVPPLVKVNAKYYGWRVALYVAGVMYASIVATALALDAAFGALGIAPESTRKVEEVTAFRVDYTLVLNAVGVAVVAGFAWLGREPETHGEDDGESSGGLGVQGWLACACLAFVALGAGASWSGLLS